MLAKNSKNRLLGWSRFLFGFVVFCAVLSIYFFLLNAPSALKLVSALPASVSADYVAIAPLVDEKQELVVDQWPADPRVVRVECRPVPFAGRDPAVAFDEHLDREARVARCVFHVNRWSVFSLRPDLEDFGPVKMSEFLINAPAPWTMHGVDSLPNVNGIFAVIQTERWMALMADESRNLFLLFLTMACALVVPLLILRKAGWRVSQDLRSSIALIKHDWPARITMLGVIAAPIAALLISSDRANLARLGEVQWITTDAFLSLAFAPFVEEVVFRLWMIPFIARFCSAPVAVVASSLVFAVFHLPLGLGDFISIALTGLQLGILWVVTRNLALCVAGHALWNAVVMVRVL